MFAERCGLGGLRSEGRVFAERCGLGGPRSEGRVFAERCGLGGPRSAEPQRPRRAGLRARSRSLSPIGCGGRENITSTRTWGTRERWQQGRSEGRVFAERCGLGGPRSEGRVFAERCGLGGPRSEGCIPTHPQITTRPPPLQRLLLLRSFKANPSSPTA